MIIADLKHLSKKYFLEISTLPNKNALSTRIIYDLMRNVEV